MKVFKRYSTALKEAKKENTHIIRIDTSIFIVGGNHINIIEQEGGYISGCISISQLKKGNHNGVTTARPFQIPILKKR